LLLGQQARDDRCSGAQQRDDRAIDALGDDQPVAEEEDRRRHPCGVEAEDNSGSGGRVIQVVSAAPQMPKRPSRNCKAAPRPNYAAGLGGIIGGLYVAGHPAATAGGNRTPARPGWALTEIARREIDRLIIK